ncbi:glycosyltransferase [Lacimicrobium alkaliphilum]|uniref:Succinoglycan biosynthesis protein ExoM n=1 Tax=Lacimicrobium alkaliphilum TaxID=1526571 RepID=A0ABQ1RPH6_9ALTE|nr:glycosyltransferase family 2 protein [Lacimicrobium alkaliphilum]GGD76832.1 succinoglycan biosynthesis protein ExoM [Lacimicrobium alkaliphilum]
MNKVSLIIGIPTFKRPKGLERLLNTIENLEIPSDICVSILVADNDGDQGAGLTIVEKLSEKFPFRLFGVPVTERGISQVRNKILHTAFEQENADFLAMLDDDETVDSKWLVELVRIHFDTKADVVGGAVLPEFSSEPPSWTSGLPIFWRNRPPSGPVDLIHGTGAILLSRRFWDAYAKPTFDVKFGLTGGGDKEFFTRLKGLGATFAYASEAISYEFYDLSRVTIDWARKREYRIGSTDIRIMKKHGLSSVKIFNELAKFFAALVYYLVRYCLLYANKNIRIHSSLKIYRQLGKVNALFGTPYEEYRNIKGS